MASVVASIDTQHEDMIHDLQYDYYAKKLATCSSDRTIKIFDINHTTAGEIHHNSATLTGHSGPVWQVAWAHPKFGTILASCSYDGLVIIHREMSQNTWAKIYEFAVPDSSVNSISWAPHEYGLQLACGSSDGSVHILEYKGDTWGQKKINNDSLGCNSVSWAPFGSDGYQVRRLVTGSCDNTVRIWRFEDSGHVEEPISSQPHTDWVRDVAWAPNTAMPYSIIASCSEDRSVFIWKKGENGWEPTLMETFEAPVWRVSWSVTGNILAVSTGDHKVTLWKQSVDESWNQISAVDETN